MTRIVFVSKSNIRPYEVGHKKKEDGNDQA